MRQVKEAIAATNSIFQDFCLRFGSEEKWRFSLVDSVVGVEDLQSELSWWWLWQVRRQRLDYIVPGLTFSIFRLYSLLYNAIFFVILRYMICHTNRTVS